MLTLYGYKTNGILLWFLHVFLTSVIFCSTAPVYLILLFCLQIEVQVQVETMTSSPNIQFEC